MEPMANYVQDIFREGTNLQLMSSLSMYAWK